MDFSPGTKRIFKIFAIIAGLLLLLSSLLAPFLYI